MMNKINTKFLRFYSTLHIKRGISVFLLASNNELIRNEIKSQLMCFVFDKKLVKAFLAYNPYLQFTPGYREDLSLKKKLLSVAFLLHNIGHLYQLSKFISSADTCPKSHGNLFLACANLTSTAAFWKGSNCHGSKLNDHYLAKLTYPYREKPITSCFKIIPDDTTFKKYKIPRILGKIFYIYLEVLSTYLQRIYQSVPKNIIKI